MEGMSMKKLVGLGVLAVLMVIVLSSCGGPISYEEAEEYEAEIADLQERLSEVESQLGEVTSNGEVSSDVEESVSSAIEEVKAVASRLAEIEEAIAPPEVEEQPAPSGGGQQQPATPAPAPTN
jgi:hypothetical protein